MANEFTITLSLSGYKPSVQSQADSLSVTGALFSQTGSYSSRGTATIATSATALPLGSITAPHWMVLHNLDASNYVTLRNGAGGADVLKLYAGEWALIPFNDSGTPYLVANTSAVLVEYLVFQL